MADLGNVEGVGEALTFVERLQHEPGSHLAAELSGGPEFIGWDDDRVLAADTRDLLLAIAAALGGEAITKDDLYPRPQRPVKQAMTVAEFDIDAFARRLAGR